MCIARTGPGLGLGQPDPPRTVVAQDAIGTTDIDLAGGVLRDAEELRIHA